MEVERACFSSPWSQGLFLHELRVPFSLVTAAWVQDGEGEHLIGYICRWLVGDEIQILNLAVHPDRRRIGLGRALVERVIDEAQERGVSKVLLEVRRDNSAGRCLYRAMGFSECGVRRNYYGRREDAVIMVWEPSR